MFLLFAISVATASPTVTQQNDVINTDIPSLNTPAAITSVNDSITNNVNTELTNLGKRLMCPPAISTELSADRLSSVRLLPPIPTTILMVVVGFLCISFYKDRKIWLTALVGLIWAGQAGLHVFPQLAMRLSNKIHNRQQIRAELIYPYFLENSHRLRCDIEGTGYIGLLHHLAGIPDNIGAYNITARDGLITSTQNQRELYGSRGTRPYRLTHTTQPAVILNPKNFILQFHCLASKAEQFICFSPAFIFDNLARGPPLVA